MRTRWGNTAKVYNIPCFTSHRSFHSTLLQRGGLKTKFATETVLQFILHFFNFWLYDIIKKWIYERQRIWEAAKFRMECCLFKCWSVPPHPKYLLLSSVSKILGVDFNCGACTKITSFLQNSKRQRLLLIFWGGTGMTTIFNSDKRYRWSCFPNKSAKKLEVHCACLNLDRVHLKPEIGLISKRLNLNGLPFSYIK